MVLIAIVALLLGAWIGAERYCRHARACWLQSQKAQEFEQVFLSFAQDDEAELAICADQIQWEENYLSTEAKNDASIFREHQDLLKKIKQTATRRQNSKAENLMRAKYYSQLGKRYDRAAVYPWVSVR